MGADGELQSPWERHHEDINPRATLMLLQNGVDLDEFSRLQVAAIEDKSIEILLANSRRRLDQVSLFTWVTLLLFGVCQHIGASPPARKNARDALKKLLKPLHEEVDVGVATFISRRLWRR